MTYSKFGRYGQYRNQGLESRIFLKRFCNILRTRVLQLRSMPTDFCVQLWLCRSRFVTMALSPAFAAPASLRPVSASLTREQIGTSQSAAPAAPQPSKVAGAVAGLAALAAVGGRAQSRKSRGTRLARRASVVAEVGTNAGERPKEGKPLKVIIAGGGVGGLTTAFSMLKEGFDVRVYEKTGKFARFGGPIQFASNATSTLKAIDERLFERIMQKFTFTATRRCGIKDGLRSNGDFRMTDVMDPSYFLNADAPADWFISFPLKARVCQWETFLSFGYKFGITSMGSAFCNVSILPFELAVLLVILSLMLGR